MAALNSITRDQETILHDHKREKHKMFQPALNTENKTTDNQHYATRKSNVTGTA